VAEVLVHQRVKHVFCVPGESYLSVLDGLCDRHTQVIATCHESGAAFMAEAYAKATGEVGVCMATRGVGAANLAIGLHTAGRDSTPVVALVGQVERPFQGREAFQEVDLAAWLGHICR
jgi:acetolactate synthase-1/2/3 large subunit